MYLIYHYRENCEDGYVSQWQRVCFWWEERKIRQKTERLFPCQPCHTSRLSLVRLKNEIEVCYFKYSKLFLCVLKASVFIFSFELILLLNCRHNRRGLLSFDFWFLFFTTGLFLFFFSFYILPLSGFFVLFHGIKKHFVYFVEFKNTKIIVYTK